MWARLDDQYHTHRKTVSISLAARGLWVTMLSWAAGQSASGELPMRLVLREAGDDAEALIAELVESGFWQPMPDGKGWIIHDYLEYQLSAEDAQALRVKRSEAGARGGRRSGEVRSKQNRSKIEANASPNTKQMLEQNRSKYSSKNEAKTNPVPVPVPVPVSEGLSVEYGSEIITSPSPITLPAVIDTPVASGSIAFGTNASARETIPVKQNAPVIAKQGAGDGAIDFPIPQDFEPRPEDITDMEKLCPTLDIYEATRQFKEYYTASQEPKRSWRLAWFKALPQTNSRGMCQKGNPTSPPSGFARNEARSGSRAGYIPHAQAEAEVDQAWVDFQEHVNQPGYKLQPRTGA